MLAVIASRAFAVIEPTALKSAQWLSSPQQVLDSTATAVAWSADNSALFLAVSGTVRRYDRTGNFEKDVHEYEGDIISMIVKDKSNTVIFTSGDKVHVLECGSGNITSTFDIHTSAVISISLSNDATLLAVTSDSSCTVHNLSLASHTVLRGWPTGLGAGRMTACSFHPHTRTRLLLGIGKRLLIYDISRPSAPLKSVSLGSISGDVVAIACSPFSKTLVAVASSGGSLALVDLDKEKGLFKTLDMKVPITSAVFSQDGSAVLLGTENGKLLIQGLRMLDKPPKSMMINEDGDRIVGLAVQKKLKNTTPSSAPVPSKVASKTSETVAKPLASQDVNNPHSARRTAEITRKAFMPNALASSPARTRTVNSARAINSPIRRPSSTTATPTATPGRLRKPAGTADSGKRRTFSPTRSGLKTSVGSSDISVQLETLTGVSIHPKPPSRSTVLSPSSSSKNTPIVRQKENEGPGASETQSKTLSATSRTTSGSAIVRSAVSATLSGTRSNPAATGARVSKKMATTRVSRSRSPSSSDGKPSKALPPPVPPLPAPNSATSSLASITAVAKDRSNTGAGGRPEVRTRTLSSLLAQPRSISRPTSRDADEAAVVADAESRTPSPDLPSPLTEPITPMPSRRIGTAMDVLGLGTPEIEKWAKAGDGPTEHNMMDHMTRQNGKRVGFFELEKGRERSGNVESEEGDREVPSMAQFSKSTEIQISPCRPMPASSSPSSGLHLSPLRGLGLVNSPSRPRTGTGTGGAQDLLRAMIKDVMCDFRQEAREEVIGLHLDLVRMGRGWKSELRALMEEYVGDLGELREENRLLKEENERLRRGY